MPIATIITGTLLSIIGVLGYVLGDSKSLTALIPLAFGTLLEGCGALALRPEWKKHAMHAAASLGVLGAAGSMMGAVKFIRRGGDVARPLGVTMQTVMFGVCTLFVVLCVRSFMVANANRRAGTNVG